MSDILLEAADRMVKRFRRDTPFGIGATQAEKELRAAADWLRDVAERHQPMNGYPAICTCSGFDCDVSATDCPDRLSAEAFARTVLGGAP